jgi:hypothetical protein
MSDFAYVAARGGTRMPWAAVPALVKDLIADRLGAPVAGAKDQHGGFSPGAAARITLSDGREYFAKADSGHRNPRSPDMIRREIAVLDGLPTGFPAPRLVTSYDDGDWVVAVSEAINGRTPAIPWRADEWGAALDGISRLAERLEPGVRGTPRIVSDMAEAFTGWRKLAADPAAEAEMEPWVRDHLGELAEAEAAWTEAADGTCLLHVDLRADNILLTRGDVVFIDWANAAVGAPWTDLLFMLPSVAMQGGPDPESVWRRYAPAAGVDRAAVDAVLSAVAGYFMFSARQAPPRNMPRLRAFQLAQGVSAVAWLRRRRGRSSSY